MKRFAVKVFSSDIRYANICLIQLLDTPVPDRELQQIAVTTGLSETAFILREGDSFELRIFSPRQEMASCVHATLAALLVFERHVKPYAEHELTFQGRAVGGRVVGQRVHLYLPLLDPSTIETNLVSYALRWVPKCTRQWCVPTASGRKRLMLEVDSVPEVVKINAEGVALEDSRYPELESYFVYAAMAGNRPAYYGRMFAPKLGITEDPVNGNSCIALASKCLAENPGLLEISFYQNRRARLSITPLSQGVALEADCFVCEADSQWRL